MSIKAGQLIHVANQILVDRAQTAGPGQVNINRQKIYELGNYNSVGSVTDIPDLSFSVESFDASAEFEAMLCNQTFGVTNGLQTVSLTGNPAGGTFTLGYNSQTTSALDFDATDAEVQSALEALSTVGSGNVTVEGALDVDNGLQTVTVSGAPTGGTFTLGYHAQTTSNLAYDSTDAQVQAALEALSTVGTGNVTVASASVNHGVQKVTITGSPDGGTFTLTYNGQTTSNIAFDATNTTVQSALRALSTVGSPNATVTGSAGGPYTITFTSAAALANVAYTLSADGSGLTGGTSPGVSVVIAAGGPYTVTFAAAAAAVSGVNEAYLAYTLVGNGGSLTGGTSPAVGVTVADLEYAGGAWIVTFGRGAAIDDGAYTLVGNGAALTGGTSPAVSISVADSELADGTSVSPSTTYAIDVASQFKAGKTATSPFSVVGSVAIPYLTLESLSYKFGITENASQTATLKGDGMYYTPGSVYIQEVAGTNSTSQVITLAHNAYPYNGDTVAGTKYALSVCISDGTRLSIGADYTESASGGGDTKAVDITIAAAVATNKTIRIIYASDTAATYPSLVHAIASATRPAAIRGRNITVCVGGVSTGFRWTSVQSIQLDWKVSLQRDEEFGNSSIISQDYDVPDVSGNVGLKPRDYAELYSKVRTIAGVSDNEVAGALTTDPLELYIELHSPDTGNVLKSFYVPDARFNLPGFSGRVEQKLEVQFDWTSDSGELDIYKGAKP